MKFIFSILFSFATANLFAQKDVIPDLKNIQSIEQANDFVNDFPHLKASVYSFNEKNDTSANDKRILGSKKGDILKLENRTYKILDTGATKIFRVCYIYLDGGQLSLEAIDSLRKIIISKYKKGTSFEALAKKYTMDGNTSGDVGYFGEGIMIREFETAVRQHKKGDVFTIDAPAYNWYFVVKKTYDDQTYRGVKALIIPDL